MDRVFFALHISKILVRRLRALAAKRGLLH